ncbi:MAG: sulfite exporter TauE/SafE family protein [Spirochaetales bacterium]|nr:sulfite exporter TauE/SafE family protein [Spirochaetales bacterium]
MSTEEKYTGWQEAAQREKKTLGERMVLNGKELRSFFGVILFFGVMLILSAWLAGNPFEHTARIGSEGILKRGWGPESDSWAIIGVVTILAVVFEFLDSAAGMGYGTTFTPLLLLLGFDPMQVVPVIMIQQACAGLSSAFIHRELGNIEWSLKPLSESVKLWFAISLSGCLAVIFSISSVYALFQVGSKWIKLYVCLLLFAMGISSFFGRRRVREYKPGRMFFFGALAGFNKGIGGGGYGPVVTIGGIMSGVPVKSMTALTALSEGTVCLVSIVTWFFLLNRGLTMDFILLPSMMLGSMVSVILAPYTVRVLPEKVWKGVIPVYCCVIGGICLIKLLPTLF